MSDLFLPSWREDWLVIPSLYGWHAGSSSKCKFISQNNLGCPLPLGWPGGQDMALGDPVTITWKRDRGVESSEAISKLKRSFSLDSSARSLLFMATVLKYAWQRKSNPYEWEDDGMWINNSKLPWLSLCWTMVVHEAAFSRATCMAH